MSPEELFAQLDALVFELCETLDLKAGMTIIVRPKDQTGRAVYLRLEPQHGHPSVMGLAPGSYEALQQALSIYERRHTAVREQAQGTIGNAQSVLARVDATVARVAAARDLLAPAPPSAEEPASVAASAPPPDEPSTS